MKRVIKLFSIITLLILSSGCVKYDFSVNVGKDKSVAFEYVLAIDVSKSENINEEIISKDDESKYREKGYNVTEYNEGNYKGIKLSKKFNNIDEISYVYDIKEYILGSDEDNNFVDFFKVDKNVYKNMYFIDLKFSSEESTNSLSKDYDIGDISEYLEGSFSITVPYNYYKNNATSVSNDGHTLTWDLTKLNGENIELEFEIYNILPIAISIFLALCIIIIIIKSILSLFIKSDKEVAMEHEEVNLNVEETLNGPVNMSI